MRPLTFSPAFQIVSWFHSGPVSNLGLEMLGIDDDPLDVDVTSLDSLIFNQGSEISSPIGAVGAVHARAHQYKAGGTRAFLNAAGRAKRAEARQRTSNKRRKRHGQLRADTRSSPYFGPHFGAHNMSLQSGCLDLPPLLSLQDDELCHLPRLGSGGDCEWMFSTPRCGTGGGIDSFDCGGGGGPFYCTDVKQQQQQQQCKVEEVVKPPERALWIVPSPGAAAIVVPGAFAPVGFCPEDLQAAIAAAAGRPSFGHAPFVLRHPQGYVVPIEPAALAAAAAETTPPFSFAHPFHLEEPTGSGAGAGAGAWPVADATQAANTTLLQQHRCVADGGGGTGGCILEWAQRPPFGAAVWLHAKLTKSGAIAGSTASHIFTPAPAVKLSGVHTEAGAAAAAMALNSAEVRLFDSGLSDVSHLLHPGPPVVERQPGGGAVQLRWPAMAVLDVCRAVDGVADSLSAAELQSRRGASGFFHLAVEVPGLPPLWLTTTTPAAGGSGGGGGGERLAPIVIKNERLSMLGDQSWRRVGCGPYADHAACAAAGSHIDPGTGRRLCVAGCRPCLEPVPANTPRAQVKKEKEKTC